VFFSRLIIPTERLLKFLERVSRKRASSGGGTKMKRDVPWLMDATGRPKRGSNTGGDEE
jgi:hypothetical protein